MKKHRLVIFMLLAVALAACSTTKEQEKPALPQPIEVKLSVPEKAAVNEKAAISAKLTQNGDPVDDADEVKFEIWQDGAKEKSEMVDADRKENGVYAIEKAFGKEAAYHVQVHVTARGLHTMPKTVILIGNASWPSSEEKQE